MDDNAVIDFLDEVRAQIKDFSRDQNLDFAWLCAVRALPYLSATSSEWSRFSYWDDENRQKIIYAIFNALDANRFVVLKNRVAAEVAASRADTLAAYTAASYAVGVADTAARIGTDTFQGAASGRFVGHAAAFASDAAYHTAVAAAKAGIDAFYAASNAESSFAFSYDAFTAAARAADESAHEAWIAKSRTIADVRARAASDAVRADDEIAARVARYAIDAAARDAIDTAAATAADAAARDAANAINEEKIRSIVRDDVNRIKAGECSGFIGDTSIYGELWHNFLSDLHAVGCEYWADFYDCLFRNGLVIDKGFEKELERHFSVPDEIKEQGAAAVGRFLSE